MKRILTIALALAALSAPALAADGALFPPRNAPGGTGSCWDAGNPEGRKVLAWKGTHLDCEDPTAGVYIGECPSNQYLKGFQAGGRPICKDLPKPELRVQYVTGGRTSGRGGATANCPAGTKVVGGGYKLVSWSGQDSNGPDAAHPRGNGFYIENGGKCEGCGIVPIAACASVAWD